MPTRLTLSALSLAAATALAGCSGTNSLTKTAANALLPPQQELALGQQVSQQVLAKYHPLDDPAIQSYVEQVGEKVASASAKDRALPVHFVVLDAPKEVNAFAIPGGTIYVFSGLLLNVKDESELAGVLAHEVGHVTERHVAQKLVQQMGLDALTQAALGSNPGTLEQIGALVGDQGLMLHFSRADEAQADADAVRALAATGYSAEGLVHFFQRLATSSPQQIAFLSDHPAPADRATEVQQLAEQLHATTGRVGANRYAQAVGQLRTFYASRGVNVG